MSTLHASSTHQGILPQFPALEDSVADTLTGKNETGRIRTAQVVHTGMQHGRGEIPEPRASGQVRHRPSRNCGGRVRGGNAAHQERSQPVVFVLARDGSPLDPTQPARARELLRKGRAVVVSSTPFVIRLKDRTINESVVHPVTVGVDPGSKTTGFAAWTDTDTVDADGVIGVERRVVFLAELEHRGRLISKKLEQRANYRRRRRSSNLRYRAPRFSNRTKPKGWLPPSLQHRVDTTVGWMNRLQRWLPVSSVVQELVRFDTQLMANPDVTGVEYQQGELAGYEVREYLLEKWGRQCVYCDKTNVALQVEHIVAKANGGSNRVANLTVACQPCNSKKDKTPVEVFLAHDPARLARVLRHAKTPLKDAAAVNSTRWALWRALTAKGLPVTTGTGGQTKFNRARFQILKTHALDAACVGHPDTVHAVSRWGIPTLTITASGRGQYARTRPDKYGFPRLRLTRQKNHYGFQTGDHVRAVVPAGKKAGTHTGRVAVRASGSFNITTSNGTIQGIHHRHLRLIQRNNGYGYTWKGETVLLSALNGRVSAP